MDYTSNVRCPKCLHEFELEAVMRNAMEADVRASMAQEFEKQALANKADADARIKQKDDELAEARSKVAAIATTEATLLKQQRQLAEREQTMDLVFEKRVAEETTRIREHETKVAHEKAAKEADERVRSATEELSEARAKLAAATTREADVLKKQRELAEKERRLEVDLEQRLAAERQRIREEEAKAAADKCTREVASQLRTKQEELDDANARLAEATSREADVLKQQREVAEKQARLDLDFERRIAEETNRIREQEAKAATERCTRDAQEQVRTKQEELDTANKKLTEASSREVELLKRQRELSDRERAFEVEKERAIAEASSHARQDEAMLAKERATLQQEQQRLRDEEHRQQIGGLEKTISELTRQVQQGSMQLQGEAQEVVLRDVLASAFPIDQFDDVPTGVPGADVLQRVRAADGSDCGVIVWESKRTKNWSDAWLPKVRDDQREAGASIAVIVTQALPADIRHFSVKDGVWVCAPAFAHPLGIALRKALVDVAATKRAAEGSGQKMHILYEYLIGPEFRNRVEGVLEAFVDMREDLDGEKRALLARWKKRERQINRALTNVTAFYGDLQGIAGRQLRDLPQLTLDAAPSPALPPSSSVPVDDEGLKDLLMRLLPDDGAGVGNATLMDRFLDQALVELGAELRPEDYERCKEMLLDEGRARRGKGKGGSVCRVIAA